MTGVEAQPAFPSLPPHPLSSALTSACSASSSGLAAAEAPLRPARIGAGLDLSLLDLLHDGSIAWRPGRTGRRQQETAQGHQPDGIPPERPRDEARLGRWAISGTALLRQGLMKPPARERACICAFREYALLACNSRKGSATIEPHDGGGGLSPPSPSHGSGDRARISLPCSLLGVASSGW